MPFRAKSYARRRAYWAFRNAQRNQDAYNRRYGSHSSYVGWLVYAAFLSFCWITFGSDFATFWWILLPATLPGIILVVLIASVVTARRKKQQDVE